MLRKAVSSSSSSWISFGLALVSTVRVGLLPSHEYCTASKTLVSGPFPRHNFQLTISFFLYVIYLDVDANVGTLRLLLNQQMRGAVAGQAGFCGGHWPSSICTGAAAASPMLFSPVRSPVRHTGRRENRFRTTLSYLFLSLSSLF